VLGDRGALVPRLGVLFLVLYLVACATGEPVNSRLAVNSETTAKLQALRDESKFHKDMTLVYPGAIDEAKRGSLQARLDDLLERLIAGLPSSPTKDYVLREFQLTLPLFEPEDSEDRDRFLTYLEQVMAIVGIESSDGLLNNWRYGFDPNDLPSR
jgi:Domain of unknown function (DUF4844)